MLVKSHHLLRGSMIIILEKLSSKELYSLLFSAIDQQPTSQKYCGNLFPNMELPWKEIYLTTRKATANRHLLCFNYKIIMLYWNNKLFQFGKTQSLLCSFCHAEVKKHSIFFINVQLLKFFGINFYYFLKQTLTFLI